MISNQHQIYINSDGSTVKSTNIAYNVLIRWTSVFTTVFMDFYVHLLYTMASFINNLNRKVVITRSFFSNLYITIFCWFGPKLMFIQKHVNCNAIVEFCIRLVLCYWFYWSLTHLYWLYQLVCHIIWPEVYIIIVREWLVMLQQPQMVIMAFTVGYDILYSLVLKLYYCTSNSMV